MSRQHSWKDAWNNMHNHSRRTIAGGFGQDMTPEELKAQIKIDAEQAARDAAEAEATARWSGEVMRDAVKEYGNAIGGVTFKTYGQPCTSSDQCASGWACLGGQCHFAYVEGKGKDAPG